MTNVGHGIGHEWGWVKKISAWHSIGNTTGEEWTDGKVVLWLLGKQVMPLTGEHRFARQLIVSLWCHQTVLVWGAGMQTGWTFIFFRFNWLRTGARRWDHLSGCHVNANVWRTRIKIKRTFVILWTITFFSKSFWLSPFGSTILRLTLVNSI